MLSRIAAFTTRPDAGNPAGVWIADRHPAEADMQSIAAEVGYSETAFVAPTTGLERSVRYFSPQAEVAFCGHATIATGVVLGMRNGAETYHLETGVGSVPVTVRRCGEFWEAALTSVEPKQSPASSGLVESVLSTLDWKSEDLHESFPAARIYAGAWHLLLVVSEKRRLAELDYHFDRLAEVMRDDGLTTVQLIWPENHGLFHSRNPFPVGGVVEDPATGAAAAAFGGYLRDFGLVTPPASIVIHQGEVMGRPSTLRATIPPRGGVVIAGHAVPIKVSE